MGVNKFGTNGLFGIDQPLDCFVLGELAVLGFRLKSLIICLRVGSAVIFDEGNNSGRVNLRTWCGNDVGNVTEVGGYDDARLTGYREMLEGKCILVRGLDLKTYTRSL